MQLRQTNPRTLVDLISDDIVVVKRLTEDGRAMWVLVARMSYNGKAPGKSFDLQLDGKLTGTQTAYRFEGDFGVLDGEFRTRDVRISVWSDLDNFCNVFPGENGFDLLKFHDIWASFAVVMRVELAPVSVAAIEVLDEQLEVSPDRVADVYLTKVSKSVAKNLLFYSPEKEKLKYNAGVYRVPNFGDLAWAGFAGSEPIIADIAIKNNAEHPLVLNVLEGDYLIEYYAYRMNRFVGQLGMFEEFYKSAVQNIKKLPKYLKPRYVFKLISQCCGALRARISNLERRV